MKRVAESQLTKDTVDDGDDDDSRVREIFKPVLSCTEHDAFHRIHPQEFKRLIQPLSLAESRQLYFIVWGSY